VTAVKILNPPDSTKPLEARLGSQLELAITGLADWKKNNSKELRLFIDGNELANVVPTIAAPDSTKLHAWLDNDNADTDTRKVWVRVLKAFRDNAGHVAIVSAGAKGESPFVTNYSDGITMQVFPPLYTALVWIGLAGLTVGIFLLGRGSLLLRDGNGAAKPPFSLAKHQMAVWFVVVVGSYLYVWLITGSYSSISQTALILIGISGATGLAAIVLDNSKRTEMKTTRTALEAERTALEQTLNQPATGLNAQLAASPAGSAAAQDLSATINVKTARLQELKTMLAQPMPDPESSSSWMTDLLSDANGISFHRLQMLVWTIVLVLVFVKAVFDNILMPDFDATLLGLMGISSGTYLGFKFPEKTT
jgi:hypothetical protein